MIHLAMIVSPPALIAFAVALLAITAGVIVPRRQRKRVTPNANVRLVFAHETNAPPIVDEQQPPAAAHVPKAPTPEPSTQRPDEQPTLGEDHAVLEEEDGASAGILTRVGSFLRFGMQRKSEPAQAPPPAAPLVLDDSEAPRRARKLASVTRVVSREPGAANELDVANQPVVASETNDQGTTTVDARGVIHQEPAESAFPVERFAQNDQVQEATYASEAERREAEHRMELERLNAEREVYETQQRCAQEAKEAKHRRAMEILQIRSQSRKEAIEVQEAARAAAEARLATWWVRLDPDLSDPQESDRMRLAGSLESVRAPWAARLITVALEQEQSERVRARLLGALARSHRTDPQPFELALKRSQIERYAIIEALTPFMGDAEWIADIVQRAKSSDAPVDVPSPEVPAAEDVGPNVVQLPLTSPVASELETVVSVAS